MPTLFSKGTSSMVAGEQTFPYVKDGFYVGELIGFEEGRPYVDRSKPDVEPEPKVRWLWKLFNPDGSPVMHPETGNQVIVNEQTSTKTGEGSTSSKWFTHHLKRNWTSREDLEDTQEACVGKRVNLVVSTRPNSEWRKIDVFPAA